MPIKEHQIVPPRRRDRRLRSTQRHLLRDGVDVARQRRLAVTSTVFSPLAFVSQVDHFFPPTAGKLKDEVMTIKPVQKQSSAGQRTRFKAYVAVGDFDGHIGLGKSRIRCRNQKRLKRRRRALIVRFLTVRFHTECSSEVATAIRGALIMAKMHLVPIRRGYWGSATASERKLRRCALKRNARHSPIDSTQ